MNIAPTIGCYSIGKKTQVDTKNTTIVRLRTSHYSTDRGFFSRKELLYMKSMSSGVNLLQEEISTIGEKEVAAYFDPPLEKYEDGLYQIVTYYNISNYDGEVEIDRIVLIPYIKQEKKNEQSGNSKSNQKQVA